jgi:hypothetical protein
VIIYVGIRYYYNTPLYRWSIFLYSNGQMVHRCCSVTTVGARGTHVVATSTHSNDGPSNIKGPLLLWGHVPHTVMLLAPTTAMGHLTSTVCCYVGTCGMHEVATSHRNNDRSSDIRGLLLLAPHQRRAIRHQQTIATSPDK